MLIISNVMIFCRPYVTCMHGGICEAILDLDTININYERKDKVAWNDGRQ